MSVPAASQPLAGDAEPSPGGGPQVPDHRADRDLTTATTAGGGAQVPVEPPERDLTTATPASPDADADSDPHAAALREVVRRVIEDLWGGGDVSLVEELFHPDAVDHMPVPGQPPGLDGLREVVRSFHRAFPDLEMTLQQTLADVERSTAVDVWTFTGTHTGHLPGLPEPTGRRVEFSGIDVMQVRDGKVAAMWHVEEMARLLAQLGDDDVAAPAAGAAPTPTAGPA